MNISLKDIGEFGVIDRIARKAKPGGDVVVGIGDDAAVLRHTRDRYLLFTSDMLIEGVHFRRPEATFRQIGWKAIGSSLSDIAAMGGRPRWALASAGLPKGLRLKEVDELYAGMRKLASRFKVGLVGGDIVRSERLVIDVAILGEVRKKELSLRSTARPGDIVCVTGSLGGSLYSKKHLTFMPRVKEARYLVRNFKVSSMIDLSDGLASDLNRIAKKSGVGAVIYEDLIPLSRWAGSVASALTDGEDFELLFTLPINEARRLIYSKPKGLKFKITEIGEITKKALGVVRIDRRGNSRPLLPGGYEHF